MVAGLSIKTKTCDFFLKKSSQMFGGSEKSRTFASAFATKLVASENKKREFFERFT